MIRKRYRDKNAGEVADLIERSLEGRSSYPQEWNDFVDCSQHGEEIEKYRKRCDQLDPLVNCPGTPDADAVAELKSITSQLRAKS